MGVRESAILKKVLRGGVAYAVLMTSTVVVIGLGLICCALVFFNGAEPEDALIRAIIDTTTAGFVGSAGIFLIASVFVAIEDK